MLRESSEHPKRPRREGTGYINEGLFRQHSILQTLKQSCSPGPSNAGRFSRDARSPGPGDLPHTHREATACFDAFKSPRCGGETSLSDAERKLIFMMTFRQVLLRVIQMKKQHLKTSLVICGPQGYSRGLYSDEKSRAKKSRGSVTPFVGTHTGMQVYIDGCV